MHLHHGMVLSREGFNDARLLLNLTRWTLAQGEAIGVHKRGVVLDLVL